MHADVEGQVPEKDVVRDALAPFMIALEHLDLSL
jgi:hypothetical protein